MRQRLWYFRNVTHSITRALLSLSLTTTILVVGCSAPAAPPTPTSALPQGITAIDPPIVLKDFSFLNQDSLPVGLKDWMGKLTLVTFGYTHCPDVCPINLAKFKQVKLALKDTAAQVNFVFVSVDGARDTPDVLKNHLRLFDPSIVGLTSDDVATRALATQFGVGYKLEKATPDQKDYSVTHTASSFLVDREGRLARLYSYDLKFDAIAADIQQMLLTDKSG